MTDREAFVRVILHNPKDDTPKLIFADWLDEHGEHDLAALIRVWSELPRVQSFTEGEVIRCGCRVTANGWVTHECNSYKNGMNEMGPVRPEWKRLVALEMTLMQRVREAYELRDVRFLFDFDNSDRYR
jgi:uncharacterized protein (TIGR02996 family)